jgi:hypothetical protein
MFTLSACLKPFGRDRLRDGGDREHQDHDPEQPHRRGSDQPPTASAASTTAAHKVARIVEAFVVVCLVAGIATS